MHVEKGRVLNFGSLNLDRVYQVSHMVREGETISAARMDIFAGGKGLNQSIALAKAGVSVYQAGGVGADGDLLLQTLTASGVNHEFVEQRGEASGHAVIQIDTQGRNCILICAGANHGNREEYIQSVLDKFGAGDWLLLQNEIDCNVEIMKLAKAKGLKIALNPSPMDAACLALPLDLVDLFFLNEHEALAMLARSSSDFAPEQAPDLLEDLHRHFPKAMIVLTLGGAGSICCDVEGRSYPQAIFKTEVVDTTAAGDCFCGFFLSTHLKNAGIAEALRTAAMASSIAVSRSGAAPSIPTLAEVEAALALR